MKPILFNTEMVEAVIKGKKTVTRRKIKNQIINENILDYAPYKIGEILYIRETWRTITDSEDNYDYRAGSSYIESVKWKPSIHMPKKAARLFLKVITIKIERIQDITNEGAVDEGIGNFNGTLMPVNVSSKDRFKDVWQNIYCDWDKNPWVWVIEFELIEKGES